jgi:hypothetical protein
MSLVKLANKLTKIYNTLSEAAQQKAAPLLRSEGRFIKGIEKGNRRLLSELQKTRRESIKFTDFGSNLNGSMYYARHDGPIQMSVQRYPKTLNGAIIKRHEIWEAQQATGTKKLGPTLRKLDKVEESMLESRRLQHREQMKRLSGKIRRMRTYAVEHPEKADRAYKAHDYLERQMNLHMNYYKPKNPIRNGYFSHYNPQILVNESKLMKETPRSFNTDLFKTRHKSGEVEDLKNRFNINYGR